MSTMLGNVLFSLSFFLLLAQLVRSLFSPMWRKSSPRFRPTPSPYTRIDPCVLLTPLSDVPPVPQIPYHFPRVLVVSKPRLPMGYYTLMAIYFDLLPRHSRR